MESKLYKETSESKGRADDPEESRGRDGQWVRNPDNVKEWS